jgi:hypothetical protein
MENDETRQDGSNGSRARKADFQQKLNHWSVQALKKVPGITFLRHQNEKISSDNNMNDTKDHAAWRHDASYRLNQLTKTIDSNMALFRWGCAMTIIGCVYISVLSSGALTRFTSIHMLPLGKSVLARVVGQHPSDPSIIYVFHLPFLRRTLLRETLPRGMLVTGTLSDTSSILPVRVFGIEMHDLVRQRRR